jgi:hypothetical protein
MSETMTTIKGIISAERPCECCGNTNLTKNVVIDRDGVLMYVGTSCAAKMMYGNKKSGTQKTVSELAKWVSISQAWFAKGYSFDVVLSALRAKTGYAIDTDGETIRFLSRTDCSVLATVTA